MTGKDTFVPRVTTRRQFLNRLMWLGVALSTLPHLVWVRHQGGKQRELSLSDADLDGPHDLAG